MNDITQKIMDLEINPMFSGGKMYIYHLNWKKMENEKLKEIGFEIKKCCGNCRYAKFDKSLFGLCEHYRFTPDTEKEIGFDINQFGFCKSHGIDYSFIYKINSKIKNHQFCKEFLK